MAVHGLAKVIQVLHGTSHHGAAGVSDGHLLAQFIEHRDESAFAALVHRHGPMVWGVCRRVVAHLQDAEDAFQAVFLVLARKSHAIQPREMVGNWLFGVAQRTALKAKSMAGKRQLRERQVTTMPEPESPGLSGWEDIESVIDQELANLPDKYRIAIVLCDLEGRKGKDVARQLKIPEGTLSSRLRVGRIMLAKRLARHGMTFSGGALATALSHNAVSACVPVVLITSTIKAATVSEAGKAVAAGAISAKTITLMEGAMKAMLLTKLKTMVSLLLVVGLLVVGGGLLTHEVAVGQERKSQPNSRIVNPSSQALKEITNATDSFSRETAKEPRQQENPNAVLKKEKAQAGKRSVQMVTYAVADLVVPIRGLDMPAHGNEKEVGPTKEDWLIRKITQTVAPTSWEESGGTGSIQYVQRGMALVVNNTAQVQSQVRYLLETMRRLQDVQVVAETRMIFLDTATFAKLHGLLPQLKKDNHVVLNDAETFALVRKAQDDGHTKVTQAPKVTVLSGQSASFHNDPIKDSTSDPKIDVALNALVAANLYHVDLDVQATVNKMEFKKTVRMRDGTTLVQVKRYGDNYLLLLVTPRVILNLEVEVSSQERQSQPAVPSAADKALKARTKDSPDDR